VRLSSTSAHHPAAGRARALAAAISRKRSRNAGCFLRSIRAFYPPAHANPVVRNLRRMGTGGACIVGGRLHAGAGEITGITRFSDPV
jgi:hypothetical protein